MFTPPGEAFVISGVDGLTTDNNGFLRFLESEFHQHEVLLFFVEEAEIVFETTSLRLQDALMEWEIATQDHAKAIDFKYTPPNGDLGNVSPRPDYPNTYSSSSTWEMFDLPATPDVRGGGSTQASPNRESAAS